ncbi:unnamed protein product [Microthlaspi erraticum]|uniref:Uncharacterized protein n=1 Tax=Microthlaspi erraticum TaxID=1685480 RepID=A0A6D2HRZ0_9BRAS|nr:unnamed protein product [Microthlaspi erraticum]
MDNGDFSGEMVWGCKPKPCWGVPRGELEFKGAFDEASNNLIRAGGKFAALIQLYDGALKGARSGVDQIKADLFDNFDGDAAAVRFREEKIAFEKKIEALKGEVAKVSGLEVENNQLRDKITQLEDKACRDMENSIAEMARLRKSRKKWAELTAAQLEKAVIRIQVDEALLSYVRKIKGVEQDFDAVEKMLAARLRESKAAGDLVEDDEVEADDYAPPLSPRVLRLSASERWARTSIVLRYFGIMLCVVLALLMSSVGAQLPAEGRSRYFWDSLPRREPSEEKRSYSQKSEGCSRQLYRESAPERAVRLAEERMFRARPKPYSVRLKSRPKSKPLGRSHSTTRETCPRSAKLQRFTPLRARPTRASRETKPRGRATRSAYHGRCIRPSRERTSHVRPRNHRPNPSVRPPTDHETSGPTVPTRPKTRLSGRPSRRPSERRGRPEAVFEAQSAQFKPKAGADLARLGLAASYT